MVIWDHVVLLIYFMTMIAVSIYSSRLIKVNPNISWAAGHSASCCRRLPRLVQDRADWLGNREFPQAILHYWLGVDRFQQLQVACGCSTFCVSRRVGLVSIGDEPRSARLVSGFWSALSC